MPHPRCDVNNTFLDLTIIFCTYSSDVIERVEHSVRQFEDITESITHWLLYPLEFLIDWSRNSRPHTYPAAALRVCVCFKERCENGYRGRPKYRTDDRRTRPV
ncbi:hypothetical protein NQ317_017006 [Molorchus minor]|uniref:Uncharacterized protein n=1 Tax=Molorchus minor TaxID=1323400 RepID=A0ABQ9JBH3_9CUCU|nr:hypothetical protein NQ317_017006 [Molorchus minor]